MVNNYHYSKEISPNKPLVLHYAPANGLFGDPIPFYWQGQYHLFFQNSPDELSFNNMRWAHIVSKDLIHWESLPEALIPEIGQPDEFGCWTGSVIHHHNQFHIFYTGHNKTADGRNQTICHAISSDLISWKKDENNPILVPQTPFSVLEDAAWRDPFIYQDDDEFRMILTAELPGVPALLKGCIGEFRSKDLIHWQDASVLYAPLESQKLECPDLFRLQDKWYLLYSDYGVQIRRSNNGRNLWKRLSSSYLDKFPFYAGKTLIDDKNRRICFGFISNRMEELDSSLWNWGGVLGLPRKLEISDNGDLIVTPIEEISQLKKERIPINISEGSFNCPKNPVINEGMDFRFLKNGTTLVGFGQHPYTWELDFSLIEIEQKRISLLFACEQNLQSGYRIEFDPSHCMISLNRLDAVRLGDPLVLQSISVPHSLWKNPNVKIIFDYSVVELFFQDRIVFSSRIYDLNPENNWWGFYSQDGEIHLSNLNAWNLDLLDEQIK